MEDSCVLAPSLPKKLSGKLSLGENQKMNEVALETH